jgi:NAD(P)-dependent dehydrogenase (short-subunit alcohol dehydrogenase family)
MEEKLVALKIKAANAAIEKEISELAKGVGDRVNFVDVNSPKTSTARTLPRVLAVDLTGSFLLTQLCARRMKAQGGGGSIVQIASVHTQASLAGAAPYDAAKHGMVGFSKAAAVELAPLGIRVNILSPGLCHTEIWKEIVAAAPSEKQCLDYWNANIPGARLITPDEIANCCVFLLSGDSSCITGANILADLGMTSLLVSREPYQAKHIKGQ